MDCCGNPTRGPGCSAPCTTWCRGPRRLERFLHLGIGPQGRLATLTNAMGWAARFGLTHDKARATIDSVWRVVREWKNRFEEYGVPAAQIDKVSSAFRHAREIGGPGSGTYSA